MPGQAAHLVSYFHESGVQASAHVMIDNTTVLVSVDDLDIAWHCDEWPINQVSLGAELTGHANQTPAQWADPYSLGVIKNARTWAQGKMTMYGMPAIHLTASQLVAIAAGNRSIKGFCTHKDVSDAFRIQGGHQDPGPNFPITAFLTSLNGFLARATPPKPATPVSVGKSTVPSGTTS
jgi:N-acetyl-anhydromuramyl-L-alanine amidase AmpD